MSKPKETKKSFPWLIIGVVILFVLNLILLGYFYFTQEKEIQPKILSSQEKELKIIFLDIGQGDAILIRTPAFAEASAGKPEKRNILIDGGPDKGIIYKLDQVLPFYERKIDLMILTHPDPDHLNGLVEVLKRYDVKQVFYNGVEDQDPTYLEFLKEIEERKIEKEIIWSEKFIEFDDRAKIQFLFPLENLSGKSFENDNEASIVFKLTFGKIKILFTGDATKKVEEKLIKNNLDLQADLLKVAHHGSKDSTSLEFLEKVQPVYSVISVGKNKFGHPSLRALRNLEKVKAKILRTDQLGDIIFETDGQSLKILNPKSEILNKFQILNSNTQTDFGI